MQFKPKTDEELNPLLQPGVYDYEVVKATDEISQSQNEQIKLTLRTWDNQGKEIIVFDYLLEAMHYKIKHFCYGCGLSNLYETGKLTAQDCIGRVGKFVIKIDKDKSGQYKDKNAVKDYIAESDLSSKPSDLDDDIPGF